MSDKRYEANIIRTTAVEPANNLESTSAPGVWSLDEVMELQKKNKWPTVGNVATDVTDVFSTFLYEGNGTAKAINNGVALGNSNAGSSVEFAGGSGTKKQSLSYANNANYVVGNSNNFTIEFFVFLQKTNDALAFGLLSAYNAYLTGIYIASGGGLSGFFQTGASAQTQITTGQTLSAGQFYHIALVRNGTTFAVYLDGTSVGTTTSSSNVQNASQFFSVGNYSNSDGDTINGFVSNLRYSSTARYTVNFTPTTSNFANDSDTILLSCQGQTADLSSNSITVTEGGSSPTLHDNFGPFTGTSGEGGLVWTKARETAYSHSFIDTARGTKKDLRSNGNDAEGTMSSSAGFSSFNTTGYSIAGQFAYHGSLNVDGEDHVSWTFRKQPKFFDVLTYTGNFTAGTTISHNLGQTPGMIIFKDTSNIRNWYVYHRSLGKSTFLSLDQTIASFSNTYMLNNTDPTSTEFTLGEATNTNANGATYVAYLFAHNNNDGEFGPTQDQDIIKCGSFTTDGSGNATVDLGFEPQWLMVKSTGTGGWEIYDKMRGFTVNGHAFLYANAGSVEGNNTTAGNTQPTSTGFSIGGNYWGANITLIYMAIRKGPLAQPTSATNVFAIDNAGGGPPTFTSGFPVDMSIYRDVGGSDWNLFDRVRGDGKELNPNLPGAESSNAGTYYNQDIMTGIGSNTGTAADAYQFMWKRAPGYFDVVAYTGTGVAGRTVNHNLGVVPEMMWVKRRSGADNWTIYAGDATDFLRLNTDDPTFDSDLAWNDTAPTASVFTVGNHNLVNGSGETYMAYLFATVAGVSKVGSFTSDGSDMTIDCGFTSGAKFVLLKKTNAADDWFIFRDIVAGNDKRLKLNTTDAEATGSDNIDPDSSGFIINNNILGGSGNSFIFYAIAT